MGKRFLFPENETAQELTVRSWMIRVATVLLGSALLLCGIPWIGKRPAGFYGGQSGWIVLSWEYVPSPLEVEESGGRLPHMRGVGVRIVVRRAAVEVVLVRGDSDTVYTRTFAPRGVRGDAAVTVAEELPVAAGNYRVSFRELCDSGRMEQSPSFPVRLGEVVLVELAEGGFRLKRR